MFVCSGALSTSIVWKQMDYGSQWAHSSKYLVLCSRHGWQNLHFWVHYSKTVFHVFKGLLQHKKHQSVETKYLKVNLTKVTFHPKIKILEYANIPFVHYRHRSHQWSGFLLKINKISDYFSPIFTLNQQMYHDIFNSTTHKTKVLHHISFCIRTYFFKLNRQVNDVVLWCKNQRISLSFRSSRDSPLNIL